MTSTEESGYCPQRRSRVTSRTATASALYPAHMHWYGSWKTAAMCMGLFDERQRAGHGWIASGTRRERGEAHLGAGSTYPASVLTPYPTELESACGTVS